LSENHDLKVWPGRHVDLHIRYTDGESEDLSLEVVSDQAADFEKGFLGESTRLAKAILGQSAGSTVKYQAGEVKIKSVSFSTVTAPEDAAKRREDTIQKAVDDSYRTSVMLFASSFNGKWGDYDPKSLQDEEDSSQTKPE
jgi:hypothetical protein